MSGQGQVFGQHTGVNGFGRHRRVIEPRHRPTSSVESLRVCEREAGGLSSALKITTSAHAAIWDKVDCAESIKKQLYLH
jgi:hypothetical protein